MSDFWKAHADYFETIVRDFKEASDLYVTGVATIQNDLERNKLLDLMNRFSNRMDLRLQRDIEPKLQDYNQNEVLSKKRKFDLAFPEESEAEELRRNSGELRKRKRINE